MSPSSAAQNLLVNTEEVMTEETEINAELENVNITSNGRPRSEKSKHAILDSTNKMLLRSSVREISIEAIAKKAGVGKTTIYRWWPNKVALILDAITSGNNAQITSVSGGNSKDLLVKQLERFARACRGRGGKIIAEVYSEAQGNPELQALFFEKFMLQHEEILANILDQGKISGEFRANLDTVLTVDMIYGAIFYQLMSSPEHLEQEFIDKLIIESLRMVI